MSGRPPKKRGRGSDSELTKTELLDAAFATVRDDGYRGASARTIAGAAGQNQAAIYYHFGGIEPLLLAAFARSSANRLERYRNALADTTDPSEIVKRLVTLHKEDETSGHLRVMAELLGGVTATPALREGLQESVQPWLDYVESKIVEVAAGHPLGSLVPTADLTDLIFSLAVGVELRNRLDGSSERADRVFRLAQLGAAILPNLRPDALFPAGDAPAASAD